MVTYTMEARENYTADLQAEFLTTWAIGTSQMYTGISYDRVRRRILYCANPCLLNGQIGAPTAGTLVGGTGYSDGDYPQEPMTGGSGSGATCHLTILGGVVTACVPEGTGVGYLPGDVLSAHLFIGGGTGFTFTLTTVSAGVQNTTGHTLWTGQQAIANSAFYDGTLLRNHSTMVKDLATDVVTRYDAWSASALVPSGAGGGALLTGTITAPGSGYPNTTYFSVPLTGGHGFGGYANITVSGGAVTAVTPLGGHGYVATDVLSADPLNLGGAGSGFQWTVNTVSTGSDGTWRRAVAANATLVDKFCSINIPRMVDPRTGDVWAHHEADGPATCEIYLLRNSDNYQQIISPLLPIPNGGVHMQPQALTANYLWVLNQQNNQGPSYLVGTPRTIQAAETTADYLLPYPWYTWPFAHDWTANANPKFASRCCVDLSNNLYFLNWTYTTTPTAKNFTVQKFTEPSSATPYNAATVGGGFTDITPWTSTTGPNTGLSSTVNNWPSASLITKVALKFLPASSNLMCLTKVFCVDLGQTWNSTNQAHTHFDVTYMPVAGGSFDYHANWLTGFLDASLNPTVLASASWALIDLLELDTDLDIQSYDFTSTGVDYSKRWFFLILSPVAGGVWSPPAGGLNDPSNRACIVQVQFVAGSPPAILQTIFDTGWNTAYAAFGTAIGNPNVITATALNSLQSTAFFMLDQGVYDNAGAAWWWAGQTAAQFQLNAAFSGRQGEGFSVTGISPPFLRMSLGAAPGPPGRRWFGELGPVKPPPEDTSRTTLDGFTRTTNDNLIRTVS